MRLSVRMEIGQKILDAAYFDQFTPARGFHGFYSFSIGRRKIERRDSFLLQMCANPGSDSGMARMGNSSIHGSPDPTYQSSFYASGHG